MADGNERFHFCSDVVAGTGSGFGVEIVGGRPCLDAMGGMGAFVTRVIPKPGGAVSTLGEVRVGDQVLEWNGVVLQGKSAGHVSHIIARTLEDEIEVVLKR